MKHAATLRRGLPVWLSILVLVAVNVIACNALAGDDLFRLGEVVVSDVGAGVEAVGTTHSLDAETLKRRGVRTLNEALVLLPGVSVRTGGDGTPRIDIRGYRTRHVLLLLDGIPINSTYDGQFDPASIPVEHIAEIKVTTGSASVLYGSGGNGGVINIISKKGQKGVHGAVATEAGQEDAYLGKLSLGLGGEALDGFVSASASRRNGFRLSDHFSATDYEDGDQRENSDLENVNLFGNLGYALSEKTLLGVALNYTAGEYGKPAVTNYDKNDPFTKKLKYDRLDDQEGVAGQISFSHLTDGTLSLRGWAFFNTLDVEENRYDDDSYAAQLQKGSYRSESTTETAGGSVQLAYAMSTFGTITLGLIGQNESWDLSGFEMVKDNVSGDLDGNEDLQLYTAALEYTVSPIDRLELVLGYGQHYQDREEGDEDAYSYLIGLNYRLFAETRLKASHARKVRFPSINQLYDINGGNSDLHAERTLHYEVGVEQALPAATTLALTLFHDEAEDFIEKDITEINQNFETYVFRGAEISAENRGVKNLLLRATYSYLDSEDRSSGSQQDELQYRPRDKATFEAGYDFSFGLTANITLLYVANQYFYDSDGKDPLEKQRLEAATVVNVKLDQAFFDRACHLYVGADNLFDEDYEESYGLPQAGRTLYAGMEYRF